VRIPPGAGVAAASYPVTRSPDRSDAFAYSPAGGGLCELCEPVSRDEPSADTPGTELCEFCEPLSISETAMPAPGARRNEGTGGGAPVLSPNQPGTSTRRSTLRIEGGRRFVSGKMQKIGRYGLV
jgi:hypothetical protein